MSLDGERRVRHFFPAILDIDLVLAQIVRRVGGLKRTVTIVGHFDFARIAVRSLCPIQLKYRHELHPVNPFKHTDLPKLGLEDLHSRRQWRRL